MKNDHLKIVISGGGTGGHIFPAIAIADTLKKQHPDAEILFVGAKGRMEMERVPKAGYPIEGLWISGFTKDASVFVLPFKIISSLIKARKILKKFNPDVVIGVGGFASGPTLKAASWLGIPTVIQEQNSYPGKTNRNVGKKAAAICTAYENMEQWFPADRIHLTGNPLRNGITNIDIDRTVAAEYFGINPAKPVALVVGGSQGALGINIGISAGLEKFRENDIQLIWQTGKNYLQRAQEEVKRLGLDDRIKPVVFIDHMEYAYSLADVVISRAGAISISELSIVGKPVIFVPLPTAAEDHQTKNAMRLVNAHAALMVENKNADKELIDKMMQLADDKDLQAALSSNIEHFAQPDAAEKIAEVIMSVIK